MGTANGPQTPPHQIAFGLARGQFIGLVSLFWLYVTSSNVLYAGSLGAGMAEMTNNVQLFAPWGVRVVQHLFMLPALLVSFWASLRIQWRPLWLAVPLQMLLAAAFCAVGYPAMIGAFLVTGGGHMVDSAAEHSRMWLDPTVMSLWIASFVSFLLAYGFGLTLVTGVALYKRMRDSELHVAALERQWSAARLAALRMQLSPHTLFNLLHTIRGQITWDPKAAQTMVMQFADLMRRLLNAGEQDFATLADEVGFVNSYLELEKRRFEDRLAVFVPDAAGLPALRVPSLILQPLAENAVVHGLAGHQGPVHIRLSAECGGERLTLRIVNTVAVNAKTGAEGIGLTNVRERLAVHFGDNAALRTARNGADWISELEIPAVRA